jgi:GTP cyclohydrolase I
MSTSIHHLPRASAHNGTACNESLPEPLSAAGKALMVEAAASKLEELFATLQIAHRTDQHMRDTPRRVAKMFVEEVFAGRYTAPPRLTDFDASPGSGGLIVTGPIELRSTCAHHMMPIYGHAYIGVLPGPNGKIIGLSKYDRVVDYFASRPQVQEELIGQIGQYLMDETAPRGLGVRISAVHMCKTHRGVRATHQSRMVSTVYYGDMRTDAALKAEFLGECQTLERSAL